ncbi:sphingomyelin synthase-related protein 1 isoform X2 [Centruroides vittatus]|uniref:sphingomyelin synthase-related protein 1 isoform X2 n=1 Tax=Centruroides vittatus TaxID=120091 RepID=UPI003510284E
MGWTACDNLSMQVKKMEKVEDWSTAEVSVWLEEKGFHNYVELLCEQHKIDGKALLTLTENDLKQPPLGMKVLGDIKRLMIAIHELQHICYKNCKRLYCFDGLMHDHQELFREHNNENDVKRLSTDECDLPKGHFAVKSRQLKPEVWKTIVGVLYFVVVTWITAIVMVIVHDRVPDMQTYPPLPDIFLDNVPLIPWAFAICEFTGVMLFIIWCCILIFHKHRFVLLRRMFSLFGSVFLLRCITMLITSLSVPGRHLECKARPSSNWWEKIQTAFLIWQGGGMYIKGVRTCGDYMFSGHTVALTLFNFFITEYTPASMYYLHTFTWVMNLFGIFFILAAHEHYSIDVFIAFYISTRLFLYYHTLANNRALMQDDSKRTRIWFPLFYFFESGVDGIVPNEYEWPLRIPKCFKAVQKKLKA